MLPGLSGHLVSEAFLEATSPAPGETPGDRSLEGIRRDLTRLRADADVGPAPAARGLLQERARPLLTALGFDAPADIQAIDSSLVATIASGGWPVTLVVTSWGEHLDALWRLAVTQAMRRSSAWCVLFNGTHLRIVDSGRLYARRYLDFNLDLALDDRRPFLAVWRAASATALSGTPSQAMSLHAIVNASDRHATTVCRSLRDGVLSASRDVLAALAARPRASSATRSNELHDSF